MPRKKLDLDALLAVLHKYRDRYGNLAVFVTWEIILDAERCAAVKARMTAPQPNTTDVLINFISAFFVPMFLAHSNGDVALARLAAIRTINGYRIHHQADMLDVAQIIAFGFATLSSLSLSMADDISLSMVLRLRGNANACNRSAELNRRALNESHKESNAAIAALNAPVARPASPPGSAQASAPKPTPDQQRRAAWAAAFTEVAAEYAAEMPNLPLKEQRAASIRIAALKDSASAMLSGAPPSQTASDPGPRPETPRPKPAQGVSTPLPSG